MADPPTALSATTPDAQTLADLDIAALLDAAAGSFDLLLLALDGPDARLVAGAAALAAIAKALGVEARSQGDLDALMSRLQEGPLAPQIASLRECGTAFAATAPGRVRVVGRTSGALGWLRLELETAPDAAGAPAPSPEPSPEPSSLASTSPAPLHSDPSKGDAVGEVISEARSLRAVRRRDAALGLLLDQVADAVALFDADRQLILHNAAFDALWQTPSAWLAERPHHGEWLDRLRRERRLPQTDDYAAFKARELARHERAEPSEDLWRLPDGRTFRVAGAPHPDGGLFLVFTDLTDELAAAARFNQLLQVQRATLDKLTDAVAVFGADARLTLHNEAFQALWGFAAGTLSQAPAFEDLIEACLAQVRDLRFWRDLKIRITDPDPQVRSPARGEVETGDGRRLAWQSRPLPDGATLIGFTDVTDARRIEQALRVQEAALEETERLKQEFAAAVSQELRTPLTTILGFSELIAQDEAGLSPRGQERLSAVRRAGRGLAQAVDDILDLTELDAGEVGLDLETIDLDPVLDAVVAGRAQDAAALGLRLERTPGPPPGRIRADRGKLIKALDRLVTGALDHTPPGGEIGVFATREAGEARLGVSDTRAAIPYDVQARIFERFGGEDGGPARLGLALARRLVELHGGWMTVESGPGPGARFTCHLPETAEAAGPASPARALPPARPALPDPPETGLI